MIHGTQNTPLSLYYLFCVRTGFYWSDISTYALIPKGELLHYCHCSVSNLPPDTLVSSLRGWVRITPVSSKDLLHYGLKGPVHS